jgi:hypothetical protein
MLTLNGTKLNAWPRWASRRDGDEVFVSHVNMSRQKFIRLVRGYFPASYVVQETLDGTLVRLRSAKRPYRRKTAADKARAAKIRKRKAERRAWHKAQMADPITRRRAERQAWHKARAVVIDPFS